MTNDLLLREVTVRYGAHVALESASARFPSGGFCGVVGPNGSGKSSLVRAVVGAVRFDGQVELGGRSLREQRGAVAWVPQRAAVDWDFPLTVQDVVMQGRCAQHGVFWRPGRADRVAADDALRVTGLTGLAERPIGALSGGQQQRTFVARALAQGAPVMLLDEPFAGLDVANERALLDALHTIVAAGTTVVLVHHDLSVVARHCDHVVLLRGRVVAEGAPAAVLTPERMAEAFGLTAADAAGDGVP